MRYLTWLGLLGLALGCNPRTSSTCTYDTECPGDQLCQSGACVTPVGSSGADGGTDVRTDAGADAGAFIASEPGAGQVGSTCAVDGDCGTGMRCLGNELAMEQKRCSNACTVAGDCAALMQLDVRIRLPANLSGANNLWNNSLLARVVACSDPSSHGLGASDGKKYCQFICPEYSAAVFSAEGIAACHCLPNFKNIGETGTQTCVWDSSVKCSLFVGCKPASTTDPACAGEPSCIVNDALEGTCFDMKTMSQMDACQFSQCGGYPHCDPDCVSTSCSNSTSPDCVDVCCHC